MTGEGTTDFRLECAEDVTLTMNDDWIEVDCPASVFLLTADEARELAAALLTAARCRDELDGKAARAAVQAKLDDRLSPCDPAITWTAPS